MTGEIPIGGTCDPHFAPVREAFIGNFRERGEPGGAVALMVDGRLVADLWGGWRDAARQTPWARETLVNFFSVGKAFTSLVALRLVERGLLDLDAPAARLWPEFAEHGKERVTLRHILSHQAGLPAIREELSDSAIFDAPRMAAALARQKPWWEPGTAHGYHVNTFGFLAGELVRRASGKTLGTILHDEVAGPLGADVHIGLPLTEHARCAEFLWPPVLPERPPGDLPDDALMKWSTYWNPPGISGAGWVNRPEWRMAEIPSTNGHGTARGIARVYAALANGGAIEGVEILSGGMLAEATTEHSFGPDSILERESRFALGFQLPQAERRLGPNDEAFGHFGAGGSLGYCDPVARVAFGYVTNDMGPRWQNPRNRALIEAIYASLA
ncbi:serine hydrolase domain-containing protein [uncultured Parvibaculum sp.]|uniref:serine hydrolase domain-containing protein n=1 Tax=uncultured Parvibaculum sp. TaxID=291828 RepID=UPI0030DB9F08